MEIPLEIIELIEQPGTIYIKLKEMWGERSIGITLNNHLFNRINEALQQDQLGTKPNTSPYIYSFIANIFTERGVKVEKVVISDLLHGVLQTQIFLRYYESASADPVNLIAADAIIMAVLCKCPVYTTDEVFKKANAENAMQTFNCLNRCQPPIV